MIKFLILLSFSTTCISSVICEYPFKSEFKLIKVDNDPQKILALNDGPTTELIFDKDISIEGNLSDVLSRDGKNYYYSFQGPTSIKKSGRVLSGQGIEQHAQGFGNPIGKIKSITKNGSKIQYQPDSVLKSIQKSDIKKGDNLSITYESGVIVEGNFSDFIDNKGVSFIQNKAEVLGPEGKILFEKDWGIYDLFFTKKIDYKVVPST